MLVSNTILNISITAKKILHALCGSMENFLQCSRNSCSTNCQICQCCIQIWMALAQNSALMFTTVTKSRENLCSKYFLKFSILFLKLIFYIELSSKNSQFKICSVAHQLKVQPMVVLNCDFLIRKTH